MVLDHPPLTELEPAGKGRVHLLRLLLPAVCPVHAGLSRLAGIRDRPSRAHPGVDGAAWLVAPLLQPLRAAPHEPRWPATRGLPAPRLPGRSGCGRTVLPPRALPGLGVRQRPLRTEGGRLVSHDTHRPGHGPRRAPAAEKEPQPLAALNREQLARGRRTIP